MISPYLPIVYVRGYAALQGEINETVDDPFYGFNDGSTHIRVGADGAPDQFFFESPLVRLMTDYGYRDVYHGKQQAFTVDGGDALRTLWIFRYYDETADTYGNRRTPRLPIEEAAQRLADFIAEIKTQTGAPKVHLVAHSMGGLVCRSLLQKIYPVARKNPAEHVARFFTYGTPHGGIHFRAGLGFLEKIRDWIGAYSSDDFGPDRMYQYLRPGARGSAPKSFVPNELTGGFDVDNVFCAIGTNARDYEIAFGGSRTAVGPQSDGLVQIDSAYVHGAHRAYVHRSHSGRYGIVNSEEAYQNLERFLFGDIQAMIALTDVQRLPNPERESYQVDVRVSVLGLPVFMNEQTREHYCPILLNDPNTDGIVRTYPVFTQFLNTGKNTDDACRFALQLAVKRLPVAANGRIDYEDNLHGVPNWTDTLIADVKVGDDARLAARWLSDGEHPMRPIALEEKSDGGMTARVPLPLHARELLGDNAALVIDSYQWTLD